MYNKAMIFNLTLGALLLQRQIIDTDNDKSNESKVLNTWYDVAFWTTLADLDLTSTSSKIVLNLFESNPADYPEWRFVYKYPPDCAYFRRIVTCYRKDTRDTHEPKMVGMRNDQKCIFTNKEQASAEYISSKVLLSMLSPAAGVAVAYRLGMMAAPLITGKGAARLQKDLETKYSIAKAEAQEQDTNESFSFETDPESSEFVAARLS